MSQSLVLVVDDEPDIRDLVREILEDEGYAVIVAEDVRNAREAVDERQPDLVLLDIWMPEQDGVSLLKEWRDSGKLLFPVVMISGHGTVETAVEATRLGAVDFIEKPLSLARLLLSVEKALNSFSVSGGDSASRAERRLPMIVGNSVYARELRATIEKVAADDSAVFIRGERATGKLLAAQHIHRAGNRSNEPFVVLRCDSLSSVNSARELLGTVESAGYLESAASGVLCLLDVEELPLEAQQILLDALQNGSVLRDDGTAVSFNARVIACSSGEMAEDLETRKFNSELYYRLVVLRVDTRPLRERREDVPQLLAYYVDWLVEQDGLPYRHFSVAAQNALRNKDWPGNVMELINFVQRLLILGNGVEIDLDEVDDLSGRDRERSGDTAGDTMKIPMDLPLREARAEFEKLYLLRQLEQVDGNIVELARVVGMERTHLYRKLRSVGIQAGRKRG